MCARIIHYDRSLLLLKEKEMEDEVFSQEKEKDEGPFEGLGRINRDVHKF